MGYLNILDPNDLTVLDLLEISKQPNPDKVLHHYKGELFDPHHYCDLCDRRFKLQQYFKAYDNVTEETVEDVQEFGHRLNVTPEEYRTHQQTLDRIEMARYNKGPFINAELYEGM